MDSVVGVHGLAAPQHVEYSQTRDQTHVPCISRRILPPGKSFRKTFNPGDLVTSGSAP